MTKEQLRAILTAPNGVEQLMEEPRKAFLPAFALFREGDAAACGFLCRAVRKPDLKQALEEALEGDRSPIYSALKSDKPKMRKNAARLCGALGHAEDLDALLLSLEQEETRFVRPSLLLALGEIGGERAHAALLNYRVKPAADPSEEKHFQEEKEALETAKKRFQQGKKHSFKGFSAPRLLELRCPANLTESLVRELRPLELRPISRFAGGLRLRTEKLDALFQCRSFFEILLPMGSVDPKKPDPALGKQILKLLRDSHEGDGAFAYRIEYRLKTDPALRGSRIRTLASALNSSELFDNPSDYEVEIRLEKGREKGMADLYLKLFSLKDERFAYRKGALPASMHPATAAAVLRSAASYLKPGARVLDPCCGSGTFLLEREKLNRCGALTGVDIAHKAVDIARENALAAESRAKFVVNDCLRFTANRKYDEVIANLPFGNRVGSHEDNERLYFGMLNRLSEWLNPGGIALFYTMEFTLLKRLLRENPRLELITEGRTDAGGLTPGIFLIRVR